MVGLIVEESSSPHENRRRIKIKEYRFEKIKEEVIETAIGSFNTTKLARYKKNKQETFLWCAHELNFLPIKVITKEKDG